MILVIDSSVWISAFQFEGTPLKALDLITGQWRIAICEAILAEVRSVLKVKFNWPEANIEEALACYQRETIVVRTVGALRGIYRDPKDDVIIECAVMAGADLIVTGDKDLLAVGSYEGIRILTPREFLDEFEARPEA